MPLPPEAERLEIPGGLPPGEERVRFVIGISQIPSVLRFFRESLQRRLAGGMTQTRDFRGRVKLEAETAEGRVTVELAGPAGVEAEWRRGWPWEEETVVEVAFWRRAATER